MVKILFVTKRKAAAVLTALVLALVVGFACCQKIAEKNQVVILGYNDLGMHCVQPDYAAFLILPPGNNIRVQVFKKGVQPKLLMKGIQVKYKINSQHDPQKYTNFWVYAGSYGYNVPEGVGITGSRTTGLMQPDPTNRFWEAAAIPVIGGTGEPGSPTPYHTATITVTDQKTGRILAEFDKLVVPVSSEMDCKNCHGKENTWTNILRAHDNEEKTNLLSDAKRGILHRCNECHADPILNAPGKPGLPSLALAMHGFHASRMSGNIQPVCYNCHPGVKTDCNRGVMRAQNLNCIDCHGTMSQVAAGIRAGRTPWLQEPTCERCHGQKYRENTGQLYRNSYLLNGPAPEMNNEILCAGCHNSPHAEWASLLKLDNILPETYQDETGFIKKCSVCHTDGRSGKVHY